MPEDWDNEPAFLTRAKTYPYDVPKYSYAFACGKALPLTSVDLRSPLESEVSDGKIRSTLGEWAKRHSVVTTGLDEPAEMLLAYGSNASVEQLSHKFAGCLETPLVPVARATLYDFDIVYSAHISSYGAIPAAIQYSPGTRVTAVVLVVSPTQRRLLRVSEPNYILAMLDEVHLSLDLGPTVSSIALVLSRHGMLTIEESEVGLAAVEAVGRRFPAMTEVEVLQAVRDRVAPDLHLDEFIMQNVRDPELASRRTDQIKKTARRFAYPSWRNLEPPS